MKQIKILVANFYPTRVPPRTGGESRLYYLYYYLSGHFDITFLSIAPGLKAIKLVEFSPTFREYRVPADPLFFRLHSELNDKEIGPECFGLVAALAGGSHSLYGENFLKLSRQSDLIVHGFPYTLAYDRYCSTDGKLRIYNADNVESQLVTHMYQGPLAAHASDLIYFLEKELISVSSLVFATSEEEKTSFLKQFKLDNKKIIIAANGFEPCVEIKKIGMNKNKNPTVVFMGSNHPPNVEAAKVIIEQLAPEIPDVRFLLLGNLGDYLKGMILPTNVSCLGYVNDDLKFEILYSCHAAINPMLRGAGTNVKVLDYMAAGATIITTPFGARGLELEHEKNAIIVAIEEFKSKINKVISEPEYAQRLGAKAKQLAIQKYSWEKIATSMVSPVKALFTEHSNSLSLSKKRLLIVTYRYTNPPLGGAEVYFDSVLKELAKINSFRIDMATFLVKECGNKWIFATEFSPLDDLHKPDYLENLFYFPLDKIDDHSNFIKCCKLTKAWISESLSLARHLVEQYFIHDYKLPVLLGGWYWPYQHHHQIRRVCFSEAEIFIPNDVLRIHLEGYAFLQNVISFFRSGQFCRCKVVGNFSISLDLPMNNHPILGLQIKRMTKEDNLTYEYGVIFNCIEVEFLSGKQYHIDLNRDYSDLAREKIPEKWIESLVEVANLRHKKFENLLYQVRGPHSQQFNDWLQDHIADYDVVLVQGITFSHSVDAVKIANENRIPCVLLPHYHIDDRFYHWQLFYNVFRRASCNIAFQNSSQWFYDKIQAKAKILPGGGIDPAEFTAKKIQAAMAAFKKHYSETTPFILILGRKALSKNYSLAIDAVARLRNDGLMLNVVIIGPDEDKKDVLEDWVKYFGLQPREIVIGALASCVCLVNMSNSESFGIVLLEAWSARRPVIGNRDCLAFRELIIHDENGFLAASVMDMTHYIKRYLNEPNLVARHVENGTKLARDYSWERLGKKFNNLLEDIVDDSFLLSKGKEGNPQPNCLS